MGDDDDGIVENECMFEQIEKRKETVSSYKRARGEREREKFKFM